MKNRALPSKLLTFCFLYIFPIMAAFSQTGTVLKGQIIDKELKTGIEYVSVAAYLQKDSTLVEGGLTDANGNFSFPLPKGQYRLKAKFIGYLETVVENVTIGNSQRDLGLIELSSGSDELQEVVVLGEKLLLRHKADRQVYSSGDFQASVGGTATDLLKNLPSVSLNAEGELSIRGTSGFVIMLNGKPVQADALSLLNQLPANSVEDIEIITSPSAKYDPEGKAGMINIITKKGASDGVYLLTNILLGAPGLDIYGNTNPPSRYGGDFTLNFRKNKWDISLGGDYGRNDIAGFRDGLVETFRADTATALPSKGERSYKRENYSGRAIIAYSFDPSSQLNAAVYAGVRSEYRTADLLYDQSRRIQGESNPFESFAYYNENSRERNSEFFIGSLDYSKKFDNKSTLSLSGLYEKTVLGGPTKNLNRMPESAGDTINYQVMEEYNPLDGLRFNVDYSLPLGAKSKLQTGYQYRWLNHVGKFDFKEKIPGTGKFADIAEFGSDILLKRIIHSFYGEYNHQSNQLSYSLGARMEHTDRVLDDYSLDKQYILNQWNFFPSAGMNYKTEGGFTWKASYSRRIERTTTNMMNPFLSRRHSEVLEVGDPELRPELVDAVELGVVKDFKSNSLFANLYYRKVNDVINQVNSVFNDSILYRTYTNAGISTVKGMELGADLNPTDWWKIYLGGNLYQFDIRGNVMGERIERNSWNYSFNLNSTLDLGNSWEVLFNLNYLSRIVTIQGEKSQFFSPNLSFKKDLMDGRMSLGLHWKAIGMNWLGSNRQTIIGIGDGFFTSTDYIQEQDMVVLTLSYKINQLAKKLNFNKSEFGDREF